MPLEFTDATELVKFLDKYPDPVIDKFILKMYRPLLPSYTDHHAELRDFDRQANALANLLKSGRCPAGIQIRFYLTNEHGYFADLGRTRTKILPILKALGSGKCPEGIEIFLEGPAARQQVIHNPVRTTHPYLEEMETIIKVLSSGKAPANLYLHLGQMCAYTSLGIERLIPVLRSGMCPPGLNIEYERELVRLSNVSAAEQTKIYDQFDKLLKTYELTDNKNHINKISQKITHEIANERKSLLKRKHVTTAADLKEIDRNRYKVLENLTTRVTLIVASEIKAITANNKHDWKKTYQDKLVKAIETSMKDPALDKYGTLQKFFRKLLNVTTVLFSPIKRLATGTFFYSTSGKSKDTVAKTLKIARSLKK
jgi:hypothetical protein